MIPIIGNFKRYWGWYVGLLWLLGFEMYAIFDAEQITLSRMVWHAHINFEGLVYIVLIPVVVLLIHFFVPRYNRVKQGK
jgi:hypothetical protein